MLELHILVMGTRSTTPAPAYVVDACCCEELFIVRFVYEKNERR
jgi:hypothetical protein